MCSYCNKWVNITVFDISCSEQLINRLNEIARPGGSWFKISDFRAQPVRGIS